MRLIVLLLYVLAFAVLHVYLGFGLWAMAGVYLLLGALLTFVFRAEIMGTYGCACFAQDRIPQASTMLHYAVKHNTKNANAYLCLAVMHMNRKQPEKSLPLLEKAKEKSKDGLLTKNIAFTRAVCRWQMGDLDKAIGELEQMRKDYDYMNDKMLASLGRIYMDKGDLVKAEEISRLALKENGENAEALENLKVMGLEGRS